MPTNFHHDAAPPPSRCSIALHGEKKKQQPTLPYFLQGSIYRLSPIAYNLVVGKKKPYTCTATAFLYAIDFKSMPLSTQNSHGYECKPWGLGHANHMLCSANTAPFIATVATGIPGGICIMAKVASKPSSTLPLIGTPITGSGVSAAITPGNTAAIPAPAIITSIPRRVCILGKLNHLVGCAMCRQCIYFKWYLHFIKKLTYTFHYRHIRCATHYDTYSWCHIILY